MQSADLYDTSDENYRTQLFQQNYGFLIVINDVIIGGGFQIPLVHSCSNCS